MFSRDLAQASVESQSVAIKFLWDFVAHRQGIKPKGREHKLSEEFAMHFTGEIERYRQYANAEGVLFQPEVFRGLLSPRERRKIKQMKFLVQKI